MALKIGPNRPDQSDLPGGQKWPARNKTKPINYCQNNGIANGTINANSLLEPLDGDGMTAVEHRGRRTELARRRCGTRVLARFDR